MIEVVVDLAPDDALLDGMSVLRRLGGRITRCDIEQQTAEARLSRWGRSAIVQLSAASVDGGARLRVEDEGLGWWRRRRLRAALKRLLRRPPHPVGGADMAPTGLTYLYLTTTGRRSGRSHEIEIWFTVRAGRYYVLAEHGHAAHWVQNLMRDPRVRVRVGETGFAARARVAEAAAEPDLVADIRALSKTKYGWGDGLVVELEPLEDAS